MCRFMVYNEDKPPMCEVTNKLCTLCVLGRASTYKKGVAAQEGGWKRKEEEGYEQRSSGVL